MISGISIRETGIDPEYGNSWRVRYVKDNYMMQEEFTNFPDVSNFVNSLLEPETVKDTPKDTGDEPINLDDIPF